MDTASEMRLIDAMSGSEFENFAVALLKRRGFAAEIVGGANDKGVDIVATKDGLRYAIQCKRHGAKIPRSAVSDCVAGMRLYHCQKAMVITNSSFHDGAVQLATANDCHLVGRPTLLAWLAGESTGTENFIDASLPAEEGGLVIQVLSAEVGQATSNEVQTKECTPGDAYLLIRLQLQNNTDVRKFNFQSWSKAPATYDAAWREFMRKTGREIAELFDNFENEYRLREDSLCRTSGTPTDKAIYPRKTVYDLLVFEAPIERFQWLNLRLPTANFAPASKRVLRFKIPAEAVTKTFPEDGIEDDA